MKRAHTLAAIVLGAFTSSAMRSRIVATILIMGISTPAFADGIQASVASEAAKLAQARVTAAPKAQNPNLWLGVGLVGGGAILALYGFTHTTGATVNVGTNASRTNAQVTVQEEHATGVGIAGLGVAALGGALLWKGSKKAIPSITAGPKGFGIQHEVKF